jgi:hypothetical protein
VYIHFVTEFFDMSSFELLNYCSQVWVYGFTEWMTFVVTLAMYPAVTVLVNSTGRGNSKPWNGEN